MDIFVVSYYIPGTLAADHTLEFKLPFDAQLIHVSLSNSANTAGWVKVGTTGGDANYMIFKDIGDSEVAAEYDWDDFVGSQYPHIPAATNIIVSVDYNGTAGTAAANAVINLMFTRG